jgi:N6-adenosine-specific RNA methylase IME4
MYDYSYMPRKKSPPANPYFDERYQPPGGKAWPGDLPGKLKGQKLSPFEIVIVLESRHGILSWRRQAHWMARKSGRSDFDKVLAELTGPSPLSPALEDLAADYMDDYKYPEDSTDPDVLFPGLDHWFHPASQDFPRVSNEKLQNLVKSIERNGQGHPITLDPVSGLILDGRHRFIAALLAGVMPQFRDWKGKGNVVDYAIELNMEGRDYSTGVRACLAVNHLPHYEEKARIRQFATLKQNRSGKNVGTVEEQGEAIELAAKAFGVSATNVKKTKKIKEQSTKIFGRLLAGELDDDGVPFRIARAEEELNLRRLQRKRDVNILVVSKTRRAQAAGKIIDAFEADVKFSTITADPPWDYMDKGGGAGATDFKAMTTEDIVKMNGDIAKVADDDCHLYLWVPNSLVLTDGRAVLEGWGFRYVTILTWVKPRGIPSSRFFNTTEQVLFGVRHPSGYPFKEKGKVPTHFDFKPGKGHSAKPEEFYTQVVERCSHGPYLELFGRTERPGWTIWGQDGTTWAEGSGRSKNTAKSKRESGRSASGGSRL